MKTKILALASGLCLMVGTTVYAEVVDGIGKNFGSSSGKTSSSGAPMPPNHPPMSGNTGAAPGMMTKPGAASPMMQPEGPVAQGKVLDVTNGAGYSYLQLEAAGKQYWIAGTQVTAKKGDVVSYIENVIMENFHSKTLNKTFDRIIFASSVNVVK